jgi:hypothetical protein
MFSRLPHDEAAPHIIFLNGSRSAAFVVLSELGLPTQGAPYRPVGTTILRRRRPVINEVFQKFVIRADLSPENSLI